jgi:hypothetical protein
MVRWGQLHQMMFMQSTSKGVICGMITPPKRMVGMTMINRTEKTDAPQANPVCTAGSNGCAAGDTPSSSPSAEESRGVNQADAAADKAERRAVMWGGLLHQNILAMRAAVVAAHLDGHEAGMRWIQNTLEGPGLLPDLEESAALGDAPRHIKSIEHWASGDQGLRGQELRDAAHEIRRLVEWSTALAETLNRAGSVIQKQEEEIRFTERVLDRQRDLLHRIAIVLKGPESPLMNHDFSDIPWRTVAVVGALKRIRQSVDTDDWCGDERMIDVIDAALTKKDGVSAMTPITVGPYLFEFSSCLDWVNRAYSLWRQHEIRSEDTVCIDMHGRICSLGRDFRAAEQDDAFPVRVYLIRSDLDHPACAGKEGGAA